MKTTVKTGVETYTEEEFARAMVEAYSKGLGDCFIVVNENHFEYLIDNDKLAVVDGEMVKASTGKKLFFAFTLEG